jgi:rhodanese-related sulfurtransferase
MVRPFSVSVLSLSILLAVASGSGLGAEERPVWWERAQTLASNDGYGLITLRELKGLYDSAQSFSILDVRPEYEYKAGHLPDAFQLEFDLGERSNLKPGKRHRFESILGPDKGREIVIYCRSYQ